MIMVAYKRRHRPDAIARLSLLSCSLFYSFLVGVSASQPETPNFMIKHALTDKKCPITSWR
jgi:hypothetical protein